VGIIIVNFDASGQLLIHSLHLSNTWENMGIQWSSASSIYRLQESLWFI